MYYKTSFKDKGYISCDFLMKKADINAFPTAMTEERGITAGKKNKILEMLNVVPSNLRLFWENIKVNDGSVDLMSSLELKE